MPSEDDGGEDMHRGNHNQHDLESAITSVASMTKNVSRIALNTKIESAKPPLSRCSHLIVEWVTAGSIN